MNRGRTFPIGDEHSLALKEDGSVIAWGHGGYGQPLVPTAARSGVKAIAGGGYHSLGLKDTAAPTPVPFFDATAEEGQVSLSWDNPRTPTYRT